MQVHPQEGRSPAREIRMRILMKTVKEKYEYKAIDKTLFSAVTREILRFRLFRFSLQDIFSVSALRRIVDFLVFYGFT